MDSKVQTSAKPKRKPPNAGKGRKAGVPNKATGKAREAIAKLADGMTGKLASWLEMAAGGVAEVWVKWEPPEDDPDALPPGDYKTTGAKGAYTHWVRPLNAKGKPMVASLSDVMEGTLPDGAQLVWITKPDPGGATDTMLRALEYHIPKLARTEVVGGGEDSEPLKISISGAAPEKTIFDE